MIYIEMERVLRKNAWLYCGAGRWRPPLAGSHYTYELLDAYAKVRR